jgi:YfiH family protein
MTLPEPDTAFHWTAETWGYALRCRPLSAIAQHAFTTKQLQLRPSPSEPDERYLQAWQQAAAAVGARLEQVMRVKQVHSSLVHVIDNTHGAPLDPATRPEADAILSNRSDLVLAVQVADCVPILLADRVNGAVAAVHAGWRGTSAGIAHAAVRTMAQRFGTRPADLVAAIGPSIGPCCYAVGESVRARFQEATATEDEIARWFTRSDNGALRLDLWAANRDHLEGAGVTAAKIHVSGLCTQTHAAIFESYRVDGERAGRMAALVRVP